MGIMGKLLGGTLGFAIGGPLGAIAGAAMGHAFDTSNETQVAGRTYHSQGEAAQFTFFVAAFSMLAKLVRADGRVSKEEMDAVQRFMLEDLNLDPQTRQFALNIFNTAVHSHETFEDFAAQFYHHFQYRPEFLELMIDILIRVSVADGQMSPSEERLIRSAVGIFKFSEDEYRKLRSRYVKDFAKYYAVLRCDPSDSTDHIKSQYRRLVSEYHPDKIASKGLPEEFTTFASNKFREIQEAYDFIKKERGIK